MNNIDKIVESFKNEIKNQTFMTDSMLDEVTTPIISLVKENKDKTPEELIKILLDELTEKLSDNLKDILNTGNNMIVPGYTFNLSVGGVSLKIYGGNFKGNRALTNNAVFDIASITKMYTQLICYNMINDGFFTFDSKIKDLDERFINLGDLKIKDITTFGTSFKTPGRIDDASSKEEALSTLYKTEVLEKEKYNYNDIGMMILKEVMEKVSKTSYEALLKHYVIDKLKLKETYLELPEDKKVLFTGSANDSLGLVNDAKAVTLGTYSGHAGIKATSNDLLKFAMAPFNKENIIPEEYIKDLYTHNPYRIDGARGVIGSAKTANPKGLAASDSPFTAPYIGYSAYGSTRAQVEAGKYILKNSSYVYGSSAILNPSSIPFEEAKKIENEINEKRKLDAITNSIEFKPISIAKEYTYENGLYHQVSMQSFLKTGESTDKMVTENGKTVIKLLLLQEIMKSLEKNYTINYDEEVHLSR